jgi:TRAP transporter 4TM/12TM fusion protein
LLSNRTISLGTRIIAIGFVLFHLYTAAMGSLYPLQQRPIHVAFAVVLTFALVSAKKGTGESRTKIPVWDWLLIGLTLLSCGYIVVNSETLMAFGGRNLVREAALSGLLLLLILETGRRRLGLTFPIIVTVALLYTSFGHYIPGYWGHAPIRLQFLLEALYVTDVGIWGLITGVSATLVALFVIFGAFMLFTGGGQTLMDIAVKLAGRVSGGAAKIATLASAFFGMISGSAVANSAATGNFTIPLMKKLGYGSEYAAAVEATASTGGAFTPPVMGAVAFVLAEMTGTPYVTVMIAAVIPSFLFYFGVFISIDFYARKKRLPPVPPEMIPSTRSIFTWVKIGPVFFPVVALVGLLMSGFSPFYAAFWGCIAAVFMYNISGNISGTKTRLKKTLDSLEAAGKSLASVVPLLVCASIFVGLIGLSGIGVKFTELAMTLGEISPFMALLVAAIVAIILGMGLPAPAAYVLCAAVVAPGIVKLGIPMLAAHMFVMYFACISCITPPVAPAVFVTSGIAQSNWMRTGWRSVRLAFIIYVIPFMFAYNTSLIMQGSASNILASLTVTLWITLILVISSEGFFLARVGIISRLCFFASGVLLLIPNQFLLTIAGIALSVLTMIITLLTWYKSRHTASIYSEPNQST